MQKKWMEEMKKAKIVSFDIFDTMIYRMADRPERIFDFTGKHFGIEGFREMRMSAQQEASRYVLKAGLAPHADFEEIYECFSKKYPHCLRWKEMQEYEWALEQAFVICNKEIYEVFKAAKAMGKRVIAVSDMYFHKEMLGQLLEQCGYKGVDEIYSSADEKATKYEGGLFCTVVQKEKCLPEQIFHIGDNERSDVMNARKGGWNAFLYETRTEGIWEKLNRQEDFWKSFGCNVGGPLYMGLTRWVKKNFDNSACTDLYFLARDGFNLHELYGENKKHHYLYVSRRSLLLAGITKLDEEALALLPPYSFGQTIEEILAYLQLDASLFSVHEAGFANRKALIKTEEDQCRFKKLLVLHKEEVLEQCEKERRYAVKYFEEAGFFDGKPMVFDCGWNGSSQYLLKRFLQAVHAEALEIPFLYVGICENEKSERQLRGLPYKTYLFGKGRGKAIEKIFLQAIVIPELLFGASHPSAWFYDENGAVFEKEDRQVFREQVLEGIRFYMNVMGKMYEQCEELYDKKECVRTLCRVITDPSEKEAQEIGNVENVDGFVKKETEKKYIAKLTWEQIRRNPRIEIYWTQGLLKRKDLEWRVRGFAKAKYMLKKVFRKG